MVHVGRDTRTISSIREILSLQTAVISYDTVAVAGVTTMPDYFALGAKLPVLCIYFYTCLLSSVCLSYLSRP